MSEVLPPSEPPGPPSAPRWLTAFVAFGPALLPPAIGVAALASGVDGVPAVWWAVAAVATTVAIVVRERRPFAAWCVAMAVVLTGPLADSGPVYLLLVLVPALPLISLASAWPVRWSLAAAAGTAVGLAAVGLDASPAASERASVALALLVVLPGAVVATAWLIGYALFVRARYQQALVERARWLERERDARAAQAAAEERARIARDLHDVVGHHVTVMVVQAEGAEAVWDTAPDRARAALGAVAATGREAMRELRETLRLLRGPDDEAAGAARHAPGGLRGLDVLVERVRAAGLEVGVTIEGDPGRLGLPVGDAALRIVQEALTNVLRHARARRVDVAVTVGRELGLRIADDGVGIPGDAGDRGRGLAGMRERVAGLGGTVVVRAGGGSGCGGGRADDVGAGAGGGHDPAAGDGPVRSSSARGTIVEVRIPLETEPAAVAPTDPGRSAPAPPA